MRRGVLVGFVSIGVFGVAILVASSRTDRGSPDAPPTIGAPATSTGTGTSGSGTSPPVEARGPRGNGNAVTFAFAGDVHFVDQLAELLQSDPMGVLGPIAPVLSGADLAMVNLETAITDRGDPVVGKNFHFRSPDSAFTALQAAGVDVVTMANNHAGPHVLTASVSCGFGRAPR